MGTGRSIVNEQTSEAKLNVNTMEMDHATFNMSLRKMPVALRKRFKKLKSEGKVIGSMNDYMKRAFLDALKRDDY